MSSRGSPWVSSAQVIGVEFQRPFSRISYADAMARFGSDRPDTRIPARTRRLERLPFGRAVFRAFRAAVDAGGIVKCLPIHDAQELGRGAVDRLEKFVKKRAGREGSRVDPRR